jgi:hypothetical protein
MELETCRVILGRALLAVQYAAVLDDLFGPASGEGLEVTGFVRAGTQSYDIYVRRILITSLVGHC